MPPGFDRRAINGTRETSIFSLIDRYLFEKTVQMTIDEYSITASPGRDKSAIKSFSVL